MNLSTQLDMCTTCDRIQINPTHCHHTRISVMIWVIKSFLLLKQELATEVEISKHFNETPL